LILDCDYVIMANARHFDALIFDDNWTPPRRKQFVGRPTLIEPMIKQYRRLEGFMKDKQLRFANIVPDICYMILAYCFPWQIACHRGKITYDLWHPGRAIWSNCTRQSICIRKIRKLVAGRYKTTLIVGTVIDSARDDVLQLVHTNCGLDETKISLSHKTDIIVCYNDLRGICDNPDIRHKNAVRTLAWVDREDMLKNKGIELHQGRHYRHLSHLYFAGDTYEYRQQLLDCRHVFLGLLARCVVLARMLDQGRTSIEVYEWANNQLTNVWRFKVSDFNYCVVSDYGIVIVYASQVVIINQTRREWG
jgi:hypothetical protein